MAIRAAVIISDLLIFDVAVNVWKYMYTCLENFDYMVWKKKNKTVTIYIFSPVILILKEIKGTRITLFITSAFQKDQVTICLKKQEWQQPKVVKLFKKRKIYIIKGKKS